MKQMAEKINLPPTGMAARYEQAWNHVVGNLPNWKKRIVIDHDNDDGSWERISAEIAQEVAQLAEAEGWKPPINDENEPF